MLKLLSSYQGKFISSNEVGCRHRTREEVGIDTQDQAATNGDEGNYELPQAYDDVIQHD